MHIYSSDSGLFIGFHGCKEELRDDVITNKTQLRPRLDKQHILSRSHQT